MKCLLRVLRAACLSKFRAEWLLASSAAVWPEIALLAEDQMDFVSLSLNYWEDLWQSRHQITFELAKTHKVLFVSPPFSLAEVLADRRKGELPKSGLQHRHANLHSLVFPKFLCHTYRFPRVAKLTKYLREMHVRYVMRKFAFHDTVLLIWHPQFVDWVGTLGESLICYYVDDDFAGYAGDSAERVKTILTNEDKLLRQADLVFANGPVLLRAKNRYGNAISVPMTADFELFSRSRLPETRVPADLESVRHPRIGYIGNLNDKVDFGLVLELSKARPDWSFVLVGPINIRADEVKKTFEALRSLSNVYILGSKPRECLPNYIKGLDVCTMLYRHRGWANSVYPLKLHEYLASGKPCIGTSLESLKEFSEVVQIADTPQEWLSAIASALVDKDPSRAERRVQVAYENRLEARIATIERAVEQKLQEKRCKKAQS
jgi:glycosyltransferase involved in cell wall biosynthesis